MTSATEPAPSGPGFWKLHGPALAGYAVLTAVCFWPVVGHLRTRILSDAGDGAAYLWNMWALPRALLRGQNPFDTQEMFFPVGAHTAFNTNMPLVSFVSWPLQKVLGLPLTANLVQFSGVILSGFGAYLLAHHVTRNRPAAFVAGAAFTLAPYRFLHIYHYDLGTWSACRSGSWPCSGCTRRRPGAGRSSSGRWSGSPSSRTCTTSSS